MIPAITSIKTYIIFLFFKYIFNFTNYPRFTPDSVFYTLHFVNLLVKTFYNGQVKSYQTEYFLYYIIFQQKNVCQYRFGKHFFQAIFYYLFFSINSSNFTICFRSSTNIPSGNSSFINISRRNSLFENVIMIIFGRS